MRHNNRVAVLVGLSVSTMPMLPYFALAQRDAPKDVWKPFRFFVGRWKGTGEGRNGRSKLEAEFRFILRDTYLEMKGAAVLDPQEANPQGEVHEDWGVVSYDRARQTFVLRQFHVEGFVNRYVLDSLSPDGKTFVFVTEAIENIPSGFRARTTFRIINDNEFQNDFELAAPGQDFIMYSKSRMKRTK